MSDAANAQIQSLIDADDVVLFMKGTPVLPQCGFSQTVAKILEILGADFASYNVLESDALRQGVKDFSNWPTIPQLYVKGEFVGGCDIVREMFETGELRPYLAEKGVLEAAS